MNLFVTFVILNSEYTELLIDLDAGLKKPRFFKKAQPSGFYWVLGFYWGFLDKQEKIGKIIQKLSNLKP